MDTTPQWNELADIFACSWHDDQIPEAAADNICIAWPSMIKGMEQSLPDKVAMTALDYGCGGGLFCRQLQTMGFQVRGYEPSEQLAAAARSNVPTDVLITSDPQTMRSDQRYDLITSIMVLQFIDNIEQTIESLANSLDKDGVIIFAVFNPAFVHDNMAGRQLFKTADSSNMAHMELKPGIQIPFYLRSAQDYR